MKTSDNISITLSDFLFDRKEVAEMKINDINRIGAIKQYNNNNTAKSKSGLSNNQRRDEVQISSEAIELLKQQGTEYKGNEGRIEQLRQAVQNGSYSVDSRKIAEKLLPYLQDN
jgi:negative regulator of flagellin synthesis FlgM